MKKIVLVLFLIVTTSNLFGQDGLGQDDYMPKLVPPSPEAAALGKYADIPISHHTGSTNISIPLYQITVDDFSLPISLSYHGSGIRVNEQSSWVGLGWVLNAGGVVMRNVYGRDDLIHRLNKPLFTFPEDGHAPPLFTGFTYSVIYPDEGTSGHYTTTGLGNIIPPNGLYDTEPDIYSFNFGGRAGKFMYKLDASTVLFPHQDLKVIDHTHLIDENGVSYYFEEEEETRTIRYSDNGLLMDKKAITANYLTKIKLLNGKEIIFNYNRQIYDDKGPKSYSRPQSETLQESSWTQGINSINGRYLSSITWDNGRVEFGVANRSDFASSTYKEGSSIYPPKRLTEVRVYNSSNNLIKKFSLNQSYFNNSSLDANYKRLKLNSVTEISPNNSSSTHPSYVLTYNEGKMNSKLSFGDHWGYFNENGESNKGMPTYYGYDPANNALMTITGDADREPSFSKMKIGTLSEIKYPTGGKTVFDYEPHSYNEYAIASNQMCERVTHRVSGPLNGSSNVKTITKVLTVDQYSEITFSFDMSGIKCVDPNTQALVVCGPSNQNINQFLYGENKVRVLDPNNNEVLLVEWNGGVFNYRNFETNYNTNLEVSGGFIDASGVPINDRKIPASKVITGNYKLEITIDPDDPDGYIWAQIFYSKDECINLSQLNQEFTAGGLRIKQKTDYDHTSTVIKRMSYDYEGGKLFNKPKYHTVKNVIVQYPGLFGFQFNPYIEINSGSPVGNTGKGLHVAYNKVKITENNPQSTALSNGYVVHQYDNEPYLWESDENTQFFTQGPIANVTEDVPATLSQPVPWQSPNFNHSTNPTSPQLVLDENIGNILKTTYFNANHNKVREVSYNYGMAIIDTVPGIRIIEQSNYPSIGGGASNYNSVRRALYGWYKYISTYNQLQGKTTIEYDENEVSIFETSASYFYDSDKHIMPTRTETINSTGNIIKSKTYYPDDISNKNDFQEGGGINDLEYNAIVKLRDLNQIASPVQTTNFRDSNVLSLQRTIYKDIGDNIVLPSSIKIAKSSNTLEERVTFNEYSATGKVMEVSKVEGAKISYIWGYNEQYPIAKIENANYSQVSTYVANLEIKSNADNDRTLNYTGNEGALRQDLDALRTALPNAMVTTYTYDPLIGVTSVTDPNGYTIYYEYDEFNRLQFVKDDEGKLVSENKYHYKD